MNIVIFALIGFDKFDNVLPHCRRSRPLKWFLTSVGHSCELPVKAYHLPSSAKQKQWVWYLLSTQFMAFNFSNNLWLRYLLFKMTSGPWSYRSNFCFNRQPRSFYMTAFMWKNRIVRETQGCHQSGVVDYFFDTPKTFNTREHMTDRNIIYISEQISVRRLLYDNKNEFMHVLHSITAT